MRRTRSVQLHAACLVARSVGPDDVGRPGDQTVPRLVGSCLARPYPGSCLNFGHPPRTGAAADRAGAAAHRREFTAGFRTRWPTTGHFGEQRRGISREPAGRQLAPPRPHAATRLAAIKTFARYVASVAPEHLERCRQIRELLPARFDHPEVSYLEDAGDRTSTGPDLYGTGPLRG